MIFLRLIKIATLKAISEYTQFIYNLKREANNMQRILGLTIERTCMFRLINGSNSVFK